MQFTVLLHSLKQTELTTEIETGRISANALKGIQKENKTVTNSLASISVRLNLISALL